MPSTRRSSRSRARTTRRRPRPGRGARARSGRRAARRGDADDADAVRVRAADREAGASPIDGDGVDLVRHVAREDVLEVGADRVAALDPGGRARRGLGVGDLDGRVVGVERRQRGGVAVLERRAAARRRRDVVWVWMVVMGGPSQRPVIAPSTAASNGAVAGVGSRHAARAAPRRVAGRGRGRRPLAMPRRAAARGRCWPGSRCTPASTRAASVAARFWPDVLDSSARASLRSALWELRAALGDGDALVAGRDRIALRCDDRPGRVRRATSPPGGSRTRGRAAPRAAAGRPRRRLGAGGARRARRAARRGARAARRGGADARRTRVGWARRRLALDPLDEDAARDLMRAAGRRRRPPRRAGRLRPPVATACGPRSASRRRPQTRALAAAIRGAGAARPDREDRRRAAPAPGAPVDGPPLVGRDAELAALARPVAAGAAPAPARVAVIGGEAGHRQDAARARARRPRPRGRRARRPLHRARPRRRRRRSARGSSCCAGLARELDAPPAEAGWPEELARARAVAAAAARRAPRVAPPDVPPELARARLFEAAVELRRARHRRPAARPALRRRPPRRRADARADRLPRAADRARCRCCSCSRAAMVPARATRSTRSPTPPAAAASRSRELALRAAAAAATSRRWSARSRALDAPQRERVVAAADGNPLLALESARAAARGDARPAAPRCAAPCAPRSPASTSPRAAPPSSPPSPAAPLDRVELAALAAARGRARRARLRPVPQRRRPLRLPPRPAARGRARRPRRRRAARCCTRRSASAPGARAGRGRAPPAARRPRRPRGRAARRRPPPTRAGDRARRGRRLPRRRRSSCGPDDPQIRLELAGALRAARPPRADAEEALDRGAARCSIPPTHAARGSAHLRAARWYRSALCDRGARAAAAPSAASTRSTRGRRRPELRSEMLLIRRLGRGRDRRRRRAPTQRCELDALAPRRRRSAAPPRPRHRRAASARSPRAASRRPRRCSSPPARPASAPAGPTSPTAAGRTRACIAAAPAATSARSTTPSTARARSTRRGDPDARVPDGTACAPTLLARLGRLDEARAAIDRQAEVGRAARRARAARARRPRRRACSRCWPATTSAPSSCSGGRSRATRRSARRWPGCAAPRRSPGSVAPTRPTPRSAPPRSSRSRAVAPPGRARRPAWPSSRRSVARARGDDELAERRLREAERHWRRLAGEDGARASTSPRSSTSGARRSPASSTRPRELERVRRPELRRPGGPCPRSMTARPPPAPVEEVWKLLYDPARFPEWWEGIETRRAHAPRRRRRLHDVPRRLPGLPDAAGAAHRRRRPPA